MSRNPRNNDRRSGGDRRLDDRRAGTARLRLLSAGGDSEVFDGTLLEFSTTGIRLALDRALEAGTPVLVEARVDAETCCNMSARVVWSETRADGRYIVGCELAAELTERQCELLARVAEPLPSR